MKHVFEAYNSDIDPRDDLFHPFTPDEWSQQTSTMLSEPVPSDPYLHPDLQDTHQQK